MKYKVLLLFVSICSIARAQYPAYGFGSTGVDRALCSLADSTGNYYVGGYYSGAIDVQPGPGIVTLPHTNSSLPAFLVKYNSSGQVIWSVYTPSGPSVHLISPQLMRFAPNGNLQILGTFNGSVDFDPGPGMLMMTSFGAADVFIWELDTAGNLVAFHDLATTLNSNGQLRNFHWLHDAQDNLILTGDYIDNFEINPGSASPDTVFALSTSDDPFVLKFDNQYNLLFKGSFGSPASFSSTNIFGLANDMNGGIYLCGRYTGTADFDMGPSFAYQTSSSSGSSEGGFVMKLTPQMQLSWIKTLNANSGSGQLKDIFIDRTNHICIPGICSGQMDFDPGPATNYVTLNNSSNFIELLDTSGNYSSTVFYTNQYGLNFDYNPVYFKQSPTGDIYVVSSFSHLIDMDPGPGIFPVSNYAGDLLVARLDSNFIPVSCAHFGGSPSNCYTMFSSVSFTSDGAMLLSGYFKCTSQLGTPVNPYAVTASGAEDAFWLKVYNLEANRISGHIYYDMNNNSLLDSNDVIQQGFVVQGGNHFFMPSVNPSTATYTFYADSGNYNLSISNVPLYYSSQPIQQQVSFGSLFNLSDTANDFRIVPVPNMTDAQLTLTPFTQLTIGHSTQYQIDYKNTGTDTLSGQIQMNLDPEFVFDAASVMPTSQTGNVLTWNYNNLRPMQQGSILVQMHVTTTAQLNDTTSTSASITTGTLAELTPLDNSDTVTQIITGPYDPNYKETKEPQVLTQVYASSPGWLNYTIHFQNVGTAIAQNITVVDSLDRVLLDPGTIELIASSHPMQATMDSTGVLKFLFANILLPDQQQNDIASQGFVRFRIKTQGGLALTDTVRNNSNIYFDFNTPVETNFAINYLAPLANALPEFFTSGSITIYPNPTENNLQIAGLAEGAYIRVNDIFGRTVISKIYSGNLDCSELPAGIYLLQIQEKNKTTSLKFIKE